MKFIYHISCFLLSRSNAAIHGYIATRTWPTTCG